MPRAWDSICLPKEMGGIGLRKMYEINKALVAKLAWNFFHSPESLRVGLAKHKYKILSFSNPLLELGNCSFFWKGIVQVVPQLISGLCLWPRNGSAVRIRDDSWVPGEAFNLPVWRDGIVQNNHCHMVTNLVRLGGAQWDAKLLRSIFAGSTVEIILWLPVPNPEREDKWIWTQEKSSAFFCKICGVVSIMA